MKKWMERINHWKLDKKMQVLVTTAIIVMTLIILAVSTISSVTSMKEKSIELLQTNNDTMAENYVTSLEQYKALAIAIVMDDTVQDYLHCTSKRDASYTEYANNAVNTMTSCQNMYPDLNFIGIVSYQMDDYLYKGTEAIASSDFQQVYAKDYHQCRTVQDSTIRIGFSNRYYKGNRYTLSVYFPIYDLNVITMERGLLCLNFTNPLLEQILENKPATGSQTSVIQTDGTIVADYDKDNIEETVSYENLLKGGEGEFTWDGRLYIYQKVSGWDYYIVSSIASIELYAPSIQTIIIMTAILFIMVVFSFFVVKIIIRRVYRPLDQTVQKMDQVAAGSLDTRLNVESMGEDFQKLATGFNSMMEEILVLMEQVKMEQHQIEQIRFNSLQSQIQPHFLYNTLDSVVWMAETGNNQGVVKMVTALASLFRISIAKGHDTITLKEELAHVESYLDIQAMRYKDKFRFSIFLPEELENVPTIKLIIQPIVENSIYHGIKYLQEEGLIEISAKAVEKDKIEIKVKDNGVGMPPDVLSTILDKESERNHISDGNGIGLINIDERIKLSYGDEYGLSIESELDEGTTVTITIPNLPPISPVVIKS